MQIKVAKSIYFVFFNRKIWSYQKKVVILQAFCRGLTPRTCAKTLF